MDRWRNVGLHNSAAGVVGNKLGRKLQNHVVIVLTRRFKRSPDDTVR